MDLAILAIYFSEAFDEVIYMQESYTLAGIYGSLLKFNGLSFFTIEHNS